MSASDTSRSDDSPGPITRAAPPSTSVDVGSLLASSEVTIRPQEDPADANLRRFKERVRFLISWGIILVIGAVALHATLDDHAAHADRAAWGRTLLAGLASALAGYTLGKGDKH